LLFESEVDAAIGIQADGDGSAEAAHIQSIASKMEGVAKLYPGTLDNPAFTEGDFSFHLM
jgi:hypothetical protein